MSSCGCGTSGRSRSTKSRSGSPRAGSSSRRCARSAPTRCPLRTCSPRRRWPPAWLPEPVIVDKVFGELAVRWPDRHSGYVRIPRINRRVGDAAPQMLLELVPAAEKPAEKKAEAAEEAKPRRRLSLPRRGGEKKTEEAKAAAPASGPAEKKATKKPAKKTAKKTAKGAAT